MNAIGIKFSFLKTVFRISLKICSLFTLLLPLSSLGEEVCKDKILNELFSRSIPISDAVELGFKALAPELEAKTFIGAACLENDFTRTGNTVSLWVAPNEGFRPEEWEEGSTNLQPVCVTSDYTDSDGIFWEGSDLSDHNLVDIEIGKDCSLLVTSIKINFMLSEEK